MERKRIDFNCDVGEFADPERLVLQERIIPLVSSVNIACGFHAGNHELMRRTVRLAKAHGAAVGAHPGYRDPEGFGRRDVALPPEEIENLIAYQVGALKGIATLEGVLVRHVKPHGALYNMAAKDRNLADAVARAIAAVDQRLVLFGLAGSHLIEAGRAIGLAVAEEGFVDRAYRRDGSLEPRGCAAAVIHEVQEVIDRARRLVLHGEVPSLDGPMVGLHVDTICLHGDTPGAVELAAVIRDELTKAGVRIAAMEHVGV